MRTVNPASLQSKLKFVLSMSASLVKRDGINRLEEQIRYSMVERFNSV
ncbi:hypothetical protein [Bradyrhizobium japonicum]|nr:hypothetical protein [Bradyrhizobium japonicum]